MPVASITEHTLTGGTLWRLNGFAYRGLSRGDACRLMLDRALDHSESETMSRTLLEQARGKALSTVESTIGAPSAPTEEASDA